MIASHTITYQHADGQPRTLTLYSNERIANEKDTPSIHRQGTPGLPTDNARMGSAGKRVRK